MKQISSFIFSLTVLSGALFSSVKAQASSLDLEIHEGKITFWNKVEKFKFLPGADALVQLGCRNQDFYLTSVESLYKGWDVANAFDYRDSFPGADFREYTFADCRNKDSQAFLWFPKERDNELTIPDELLEDDYDSTQLPLNVQLWNLVDGSKKYFKCAGERSKEYVSENEEFKIFNVKVDCAPVDTIAKKLRGPIDFTSEPGPYGAPGSYRGRMLPPLAPTTENLVKITQALLAKIPAGKYAGKMSTLTKLCEVEIKLTNDALEITHTTITSSGTRRERKLSLKAEDILGFTEGDLFEDLNGIEGDPVGKYSAGEFREPKKAPVSVRFEQNDGLDGKVLRINGATTYCRRLEKIEE